MGPGPGRNRAQQMDGPGPDRAHQMAPREAPREGRSEGIYIYIYIYIHISGPHKGIGQDYLSGFARMIICRRSTAQIVRF